MGSKREWSAMQMGAVSAIVCAGICGVGALLSSFVPFASAIPLFIGMLLFIAWRLPLLAALLSCFASVLSLDFSFTAPRQTLRVFSGQDVAVLSSFLAVVLFISVLSDRLSQRTDQLTQHESAQRALHALAVRNIQMDWREPAAAELCRAVRSCFRLQSVCIWDAREELFACDGDAAQAEEALRAAYMANRDFDVKNNGVAIRVLRSGVRPIGTIQLRGRLLDDAIVGALVSLVSLTMERAFALSSEVDAQSERLSEQLRSSVLDGLAHSIKTPLTTISVAASGVATVGEVNELQSTLLTRVEDQTQRIVSLTDRLLRTARMDSRMIAKRRQVDLADLLRDSLREIEDSSRLHISDISSPCTAFLDPDLLRMAVTQIAENALKYSTPESFVHIALEEQHGEARITIRNVGSFIPRAESLLIFKRFYRGHGFEHRAPGTGLGLSVAKNAVEAMGGQIALESSISSGTTFTVHVPVQGKQR